MSKIEINNAKEEINEIVNKCNACGLCKELDPVFKALREEALSSRGRAILFEKASFDKQVFDDPLSGQCKEKCPFNIDIDNAMRKARKILNNQGKENKEMKLLVTKIRNNENPYE